MKKVSKQQIDRLYEFTRQHYVEYYDVQTELVDHLANAIEEHWEENADQDFEELLHREFKKFGIFGFTGLVEKKEYALQKNYNSIVWKKIKSFLLLPKVIIATFILFVIHFLLLKYKFSEIIFHTLYLVIFLSGIVAAIIRNWKHKRQLKKEGKMKLLVNKVIYRMRSGVSFCYFPYAFFPVLDILPPTILLPLSSFYFTYLLIALYVCIIEMPAIENELMEKAYKNLNLI
ncbi:hypothetical protein [Mesonia maritima]|uniref:Uncharacterized protein n=1 Tax=Mesonia maritima TaxID=1793873 RepID=A0ABU1K2K4_9FLAO|nr:hypothetical protein [Mesonia maritima]MDR6299836.1 hypothetical protein [Mesonia maritima]